jgi:hypothetical protein
MNLIEVFESMPKQDVKTFNKIFKSTPIENKNNPEVQILDLLSADERRIRVGSEFIRLCLKQKKDTRRITKNYQIVNFQEKVCTKCHKNKPFAQFSPHRTSKGGVRSACKECCTNEVIKWKKKNKDKLTQNIK